MMLSISTLIVLFLASLVSSSVWPLPQTWDKGTNLYIVNKNNFTIVGDITQGIVIPEAVKRYQVLLFLGSVLEHGTPNITGQINQLQIFIENRVSEVLDSSMDESYQIIVNNSGIILKSKEVWGIIRGLETLSQLIELSPTSDNYYISEAVVTDEPRFPVRGLLIDSSRRYMPLSTLKQMLDAMSYNKFNMMHWHLSDDQAFPYQSMTFPNLTEYGTYHPVNNHIYTRKMILEVIEYAYLRGIRVMPEFDSPSHFTAWTGGYPELGVQDCGQAKYPIGIIPVNPVREFTYQFLDSFYDELRSVFIDDYVHLGGDEHNPRNCWSNSPEINTFMSKQGWGTNYTKLTQYYENRLVEIANNRKFSTMAWSDLVDLETVMDKNTTMISIWKLDTDWRGEMGRFTANGYQVLVYAAWYMDYGEFWTAYYNREPLDFPGTDQQKSLVKGGIASLWSAGIDSSSLVTWAWPYASAVAERLWSKQSVNDAGAATPRIEAMRCLMIRRGIPSKSIYFIQPCYVEYTPIYNPPWMIVNNNTNNILNNDVNKFEQCSRASIYSLSIVGFFMIFINFY